MTDETKLEIDRRQLWGIYSVAELLALPEKTTEGAIFGDGEKELFRVKDGKLTKVGVAVYCHCVACIMPETVKHRWLRVMRFEPKTIL